MGDKQREDLINVFTRWLDTNPSKGLNPIQCATIAQDYANQRVIEELENTLYILEFALDVVEFADLENERDTNNWVIGRDLETEIKRIKELKQD